MVVAATGRNGTIGTFYPSEVLSLSFSRFCSEKVVTSYPQIDTLIHGAGIVGEPLVRQDVQTARLVNVSLSGELVNQLIESKGLRRLVYVSTAHVYARAESAEKLTETSPLGPVNNYAEQKLEAELLLTNQLAGTEVELLILRVFSIFGTNGRAFTLGGRLAEIARGGNVEIGNSDDVRDFLTPSVAARAIYDLAASSQQGVLNVCTGIPMRISEAVSSWLQVEEPRGRVKFVSGQSNLPYLVGDSSRLEQVLDEPLAFVPGEA